MPRQYVIAGLFALAAAGCIVTDEIEFSENVNYPPEVTGAQPDTSAVLPVCRDDQNGFEEQRFVVSLWEPDEEDAPPRTDAMIHLWLDADQSSEAVRSGDCTVGALSPTEESGYEGGVLLTVTCTMDIPASVSEGDTLMVRVLVSDRGFVGEEDQRPETARTAAVFWTLVVVPSDACGK